MEEAMWAMPDMMGSANMRSPDIVVGNAEGAASEQFCHIPLIAGAMERMHQGAGNILAFQHQNTLPAMN
jgi:hypothetical protein